MKCQILHEGKGRIRVHVCNVRMTLHRADVLEAWLNSRDAIEKAVVYERTGDVVVTYAGKRSDAVKALAAYRFDDPELDALVTSADSRKINQEYQSRMCDLVAGHFFRKLFLPAPCGPPTRCTALWALSGKASAACGGGNWKSRCWMHCPSASRCCGAISAPPVPSCSC